MLHVGCAMIHCRHLFGSCFIGDAGVAAVAEVLKSNLSVNELKYVRLSCSGPLHCSHNWHMTNCRLHSNKITEFGAAALAVTLKHNPPLQVLKCVRTFILIRCLYTTANPLFQPVWEFHRRRWSGGHCGGFEDQHCIKETRVCQWVCGALH